MELRAAFRNLDITPPIGLPMGGYMARRGVAQGILDPLTARLVVLEAGILKVLLVVLEVDAVGEEIVQLIRSRLRRAVGCLEEHIIVATTHTHSGPQGFEKPNPACSEYVDSIVSRIVEGVTDSSQRLREVRVHVARVNALGIAANRLHPDEPVDPEVVVAVFLDKDAPIPVGVLANYACHPTVLGSANLKYSGDIFGFAARAVQKELGVPCVLTNAAEGDVSTRFTRRAQDYTEVARLGEQLGTAILKGVKAAQALPPDLSELKVVHETVRLPLRRLPSVAEAEEVAARAREELERATEARVSSAELRRFITRHEGALLQLTLAQGVANASERTIDITGLRIGSLRAVTVPGEAF